MIVLRMIAGHNAAEALMQIKLIATRFPGKYALAIHVRTPDQLIRSEKGRQLILGPDFRYSASDACLAALREFGDVEALC